MGKGQVFDVFCRIAHLRQLRLQRFRNRLDSLRMSIDQASRESRLRPTSARCKTESRGSTHGHRTAIEHIETTGFRRSRLILAHSRDQKGQRHGGCRRQYNSRPCRPLRSPDRK